MYWKELSEQGQCIDNTIGSSVVYMEYTIKCMAFIHYLIQCCELIKILGKAQYDTTYNLVLCCLVSTLHMYVKGDYGLQYSVGWWKKKIMRKNHIIKKNSLNI